MNESQVIPAFSGQKYELCNILLLFVNYFINFITYHQCQLKDLVDEISFTINKCCHPIWSTILVSELTVTLCPMTLTQV